MYFALQLLLILGNDLSHLDASLLMSEVAALQLADGSFPSAQGNLDADTRFTYMAFAIRYILQHLVKEPTTTDFDTEKALLFVSHCRNYDGGFGGCPGAESHAGLTWCALAAIHLHEPHRLIAQDPSYTQTIHWLLQRQNADGGFNGRFGKVSDVCYCFWITASCCILGVADLLDQDALAAYFETCQTP
ncbi:terpenoid cyclases/protein prenyltransferase alpha-alpha toroid [Protomyces lactucae-debilis]|uniref:Geranylgeranyl transferase type II subunit beta n=1 Tax=Protomyces lactucae-debilis TaxID=2754530 RepID=A0A1Y2FLJ6_PROLT|nr:terpenoid cyclases/protein prenyltransferase alpha-alpha toroid [Protomyces lactucae-debilis]ORY84843.1 terpenoid cyclases/protein prenyltransferase alpha-alpha toroid [Protomyces lactucae-debilis]